MSMFSTQPCDLSRQELERLISGSLMRLSTSDRNPFFGALALMAPIEFTERIETAATDGERLLFNPAFLAGLSAGERDAVIVHEVLHAALLHVPRCGSRDPLLWNIACDIVVNGMVATDPRLKLPAGTVRDTKLEHLQAEEVYEVIIRQRGTVAYHLGMHDLQPELGSGAGGQLGDPEARRELERRWSEITARAAMVSRARCELPNAIERQIGSLLQPKVDWRTRLWQFLVRTPDDYGGFDRRLMWQGLYLEHLESDQVFVDICVDTSGSIEGEQLDAFLGEVRGILHAYHRIEVRLFYADAACHGPFPLSRADKGLPKPIGGGGTDFSPFFETIAHEQHDKPDACRVLVYLTDGEGHFPSEHPTHPCLWVVTPGGADDSQFPFGEVLRMS